MKILGACARIAESAAWGAVEGMEKAFFVGCALNLATRGMLWVERAQMQQQMQCPSPAVYDEAVQNMLPYVSLIGAVAGAYFGALRGIGRELQGVSNGALIG